jgi:cell division septal protein FtsQ
MSCSAPRSVIEGHVRPSPARRGRRVLGAVRWLAAGLVLAVAAAAAVSVPVNPALGPRAWAEAIVEAVGLRISRVDVRGNGLTQRSEVVAALRAGLTDPMSAQPKLPDQDTDLPFWLDLEAARRRIEALAWVHTAKLARMLPDGLAVEITERRPAFVWRRDDQDTLLDSEGRELSRIQRGSAAGLPVVAGEGAGPAGPRLMAMLKGHPEVERRMVEARRIEDRRWTLVMTGGTLLHLPGDGTAAALAWSEAQAGSGLLDRGLEVIDLRVSGQLVVRDRPGAQRRASVASSGATPGGRP